VVLQDRGGGRLIFLRWAGLVGCLRDVGFVVVGLIELEAMGIQVESFVRFSGIWVLYFCSSCIFFPRTYWTLPDYFTEPLQ